MLRWMTSKSVTCAIASSVVSTALFAGPCDCKVLRPPDNLRLCLECECIVCSSYEKTHRQVTLDHQHYPQTEMRFPYACRTRVFDKNTKLRTGSYMRLNVSSVEIRKRSTSSSQPARCFRSRRSTCASRDATCSRSIARTVQSLRTGCLTAKEGELRGEHQASVHNSRRPKCKGVCEVFNSLRLGRQASGRFR